MNSEKEALGYNIVRVDSTMVALLSGKSSIDRKKL